MQSKQSRLMLILSIMNFGYAIWRCLRIVNPKSLKVKFKEK
ncbi:hypothetical protein ACFP3T_08965 [Lactiplantibacillus dongliensis]|uniref:Uncharacterized protein n=1 Tax=Lactiplantibacillus dongliensis TaxID=2559919 RepID=A0ABW1R5S6_9LACO|nr:hypothetical protein [Lactiplantibacillus dongliensis]